MARTPVPASTDILCESCGYTLNGLPDDGNCPECGNPVAYSTTAAPRHLPAWEIDTLRPSDRFIRTAREVIFHPRYFFQHLIVHTDAHRARRFAQIAFVPVVAVGSKAVLIHVMIMIWLSGFGSVTMLPWLFAIVPIAVALAWIGTHLAVVPLTSIEARYWGYRLPTPVVRRVLHYLTPHAVIASALPLLVSSIYLMMLAKNDTYANYLAQYSYCLSAAVVLSAGYLFRIYWLGMIAVRYANK